MNRRLFLALWMVLTFGGCSYEKVEQEIGHVGPARRDPFLAAQRFLAAREFSVNATTRFSEALAWRGTVVTPAQSFVIHGMTEHVLSWVERGGHLVVFLRDGEAFRNDWTLFSFKDLQAPDPEVQRLFDALGIESVRPEATTAKGIVFDRQVEYKSPASFSWKEGTKPRQLQFALGTPGKVAAASLRRGSGYVTIIASAKPFRNRYIGEDDNAWTFWLMLSRVETTGIWFLQGARLSFFGMLWEHGWMAIVGLLLLVAFWLWRHLPRFGPLREAPVESNRDFASHLGVIGAFEWRHGQASHLLKPLREAISRGAARRGWSAGDDRLQEHLSHLSGVAPERIQTALHLEPREHQSFLAVVQDLQRIAIALRA